MGGAAEMSKILCVEGSDDMHVVSYLLNQKLPFGIKVERGVTELLKAVGPEIKVSERVAIGFLLDANDDLAGRWRDVSKQLRKEGICAPQDPSPEGTVIPGLSPLPRVGVWLMPDNQSAGELEDFVRSMIPEDDLAWKLARRYIQDIPEGERKFRPKKTSRAELHAWLSARENPGLMGLAIHRGDLKTDGDLCRTFLAWLEKLFA